MRTRISAVLVLLALAWPAHARDLVSISATRKTTDTRKGEAQSLARGVSRATQDIIYYRFDLQSQSGNVPDYVTVQWIVLIEGIGGQVRPATSGESNMGLPFRRTVNVETDTFELKGREWSMGPRPGTVKESVVGYGVRVLDTGGQVLAEKYGPPSIENQVDWNQLKPQEKNRARNLPFRGRNRKRRYPMDPDQDPDRQ